VETKDGQEVAVKVQCLDLDDRFNGDMSTISLLLKIVAFMDPYFNFQWVLEVCMFYVKRSGISEEQALDLCCKF
jgi:predicted unusual protein kinase regulating ubiquinone biosynthesis (AarF/ABC1/UbiB family)